MPKLFIRIALTIILALGAIGGCGGYGIGARCNNCPCDFFSVPMTGKCWEIGPDQPAFDPFPPSPGTESDSCGISIPSVSDGGAFITDNFFTGRLSCTISGLDTADCPAPDESQVGLTRGQFADCRICLEEYATALNESGITVTGGPPYTCIPVDACIGCWDY